MSEKILITGASGMLGRYVRHFVEEAGYDPIIPGRDQVELSDPAGVQNYVLRVKPDAILHLSAETDVDLCERDPRRAAVCNGQATEALASAAHQLGCWMLYVSTSNVFGAENKPFYNELDLPCPVNYYGRSKLYGERVVQNWCGRNSMVVRAGWMIGGGAEYDHKFVGKIIKQVKEGAELLRAVGDRYGTITQARKLALFIIASLKKRRKGTFHFASLGAVSRLEIAHEIAACLSFKGRVEGVVSALFPLSAPRPVFEGIESVLLAGEPDVDQPADWRLDLRNYLREFEV